jgi:hypothetical protein
MIPAIFRRRPMNATDTVTAETARYALHIVGSDVYAFEIVHYVSGRTLDVRRLKAIPDPTWRPAMTAGGFVGHVSNDQERGFRFEIDPYQYRVRIRLTKRGWRSAFGCHFVLSDEPREFYDSNF